MKKMKGLESIYRERAYSMLIIFSLSLSLFYYLFIYLYYLDMLALGDHPVLRAKNKKSDFLYVLE